MVEFGLLIGFVIGGFALCCVWVANHSQSWHEKHHTHHSELMCDFCQKRRQEYGYGVANRRWPMRIFGERPPRGTG